ncbi:MAG: NADH-quinone oxidoreductase subunit NuoE [Azoarcus sp.]|nr:NADH-quinone oxidoreductase subunit NuoE [Azoarcus sp.]
MSKSEFKPLSQEALRLIDREIAKYPAGKQQSAVMSALRIAQQEKGWLAPETIEEVANYLGMPPVAAWEVATFYNMFDLEPVGRHKITVCTNLPCMLSGSLHVAAYLKEKLGIEFDETTADGQFTLKEGECMGACGDAPVLLHNNHQMCARVSKDEIDRRLAEWRSQ